MREERNVLDELLGTAEEDDLDIGELISNDKHKKRPTLSPPRLDLDDLEKSIKDNKESKRNGTKLKSSDDEMKSLNGRLNGKKENGKESLNGNQVNSSSNRKERNYRKKRSVSESASSDESSCSCDNHSSDSFSETGSYSIHSNSPRAEPISSKSKKHSSRSSKKQKTERSKRSSRKDEAKKHSCKSHIESSSNIQAPTTNNNQATHKPRDYLSLIKYFFKDAIYYVIKSNNHENVELSKSKGVWSTPPQNEQKLNRAFNEYRNVILIFSVKESGKFQGFARLSSESRHDQSPVQWILPPGLSAKALGGVFALDWVNTNELSFNKTLHLFNPLNEGKPVKIARDGQEIDSRVGEELCRLFPADETTELIPHLKRMKKQTTDRPKVVHSSSRHRSSNSDFSSRRRSNQPPLYSNNHPMNLNRTRLNNSSIGRRDFRGNEMRPEQRRIAPHRLVMNGGQEFGGRPFIGNNFPPNMNVPFNDPNFMPRMDFMPKRSIDKRFDRNHQDEFGRRSRPRVDRWNNRRF